MPCRDWPLLNALLNTASGATWVSLHHGGGVGMGYSQHAGVVIVCDGTRGCRQRIERVLWNDPATGVMRHADAGYEIAIECAREHGPEPADARSTERARMMLAPGMLTLDDLRASTRGWLRLENRRDGDGRHRGRRRSGGRAAEGDRRRLRRQYRFRQAGNDRIPAATSALCSAI